MVRVLPVAVITATMMAATVAGAQGIRPAIPFLDEWQGSPHAKADAEAFTHWNEDGEVDVACARCHSTPGFQDYLGADDSTPWKVDQPAALGTVVECVACHNQVTRFLNFVTFPSGLRIEDVGDQARCMSCHQGRASTISVNEALAGKGDDAVDAELKFINVHYRAAAATRYGTEAKGGYEYDGATYAGYYLHDKDSQTCMQCHDPHTTKILVEDCAFCHRGVQTEEDFADIREMRGDFDGDGDDREGIAQEIGTLHDALYAAIVEYAKSVGGSPIVYGPHNYPYFFVDLNENGQPDDDELQSSNAYKSWTPRLLRAAYNYQYVAKDPGAFTHNPVYAMELLYDSIADLGSQVTVAMDGMTRP